MGKLGLSTLISDGMVIPQGVPFPIQGNAAFSIKFQGKKFQSQENEDGKWHITLDPIPAGGPFTMDIETAAPGVPGEGITTIHDIYSGDVWLCAGQSNMEMHMDRLRDNFPEEWQAPHFPAIHQFSVPQEWDFSGPRTTLSGSSWITASKENLDAFSATAWFFAKNMYEKYRVPIGLVATAWGGTPIEAWMSREALVNFPVKIADGEQYADPALCAEVSAKHEAAIREWEDRLLREDRGLVKEWQNNATDVANVTDVPKWNTINLPGDFSEAGLANFCGIIWLCREFSVTADFAKEETKVWLGTIVDADTVYINGVEVGNTGYRYPPRKYRIPAGLLREGKNRIVIRVCCTSGDGGITKDKPFRILSEQGCMELAGAWKYRIGTPAPPRPAEFFFQRQPMGPFNAMIAPVLKYPFKGVIWYQGESNENCPGEYAALFKAMVQDWRKKSGREFPFLFVQLPIFGNAGDNDESASWALIRKAQQDALSLPHTGMAAALEFGEWNDIHPLNKKDVGYRLFLAAENVPPGPMVQRVERRKNKLIIIFTNYGSGLCAQEQPHVSIISEEGSIRCPATIDSPNTVSVDISAIKNPQKILYAWANNPRDRQLSNSEGLPVLPFMIPLSL